MMLLLSPTVAHFQDERGKITGNQLSTGFCETQRHGESFFLSGVVVVYATTTPHHTGVLLGLYPLLLIPIAKILSKVFQSVQTHSEIDFNAF